MTLLLASPSIDVNQAKNNGTTPLFIAAQNGHAECATLFLASPSIDVNRAQNNGATPLIDASRSRSTAAALTLIADGRTELDTKDSEGASALSCASEGDNAQLVAALIARGADPLAAFPNPLVADCVVGRALEARARLEGSRRRPTTTHCQSSCGSASWARPRKSRLASSPRRRASPSARCRRRSRRPSS